MISAKLIEYAKTCFRAAGIACCLLPASGIAGAIDNLQPGHWYKVPNSKMDAVAPDQIPPGITGVRSVMDAWGGGVYDSVREQLVVWGGGHMNYSGNELYAFNVNTESWKRLTDPSNPVEKCVPYYPDGGPVSRHTYDDLVFAPNVGNGRFITMGAAVGYCETGAGNNNIDVFDFDSGSWLTNVARIPDVGNIGAAAYDPKTGHIWHHPGASGKLIEYDPVSNSIKTYTNGTYLKAYANATIDPTRHIMVTLGGYDYARQVYVWDLDNPGVGPSSPATKGATEVESSEAPGFEYDPISDKFIAWNGGTHVYVLDPDTWTWTKIAAAASNTVVPTAKNDNGTYGRFRYIPSKNAFILVNRTSEDVYYYKLTSGSGTSGTTQPAPAVTLSAAPTQVAFGGSTTLSWSSVNASECTASGDWSGAKGLSGEATLSSLTASGSYALTCTGAGGSASSDSVVVTVSSGSTTGGTVSGALQVGADKQYKTVAAAVAVAQNGDVIEVDAGTYEDDIVVFRQNDLTIRGIGGRAHIKGTRQIPYTAGVDTENGMGLWVVRGSRITIENIEFSGASVPDGNGAGIRIQGADLTIRNCYFHDSENGILGGGGTLTVENSHFDNNGLGDGFTHNIYIDTGDTFILRHSYSHHARIGHNVKSKAKNNYIISNRIMDESSGTSSYAIDIPKGGLTYVIGNLIQQGPRTDNPTVVSYAAEGSVNPVQQLNFINNTVVNDRGSGRFLSVSGGAGMVVTNNLFVGSGTLGFSGGQGNIATSSPNFVDRSNYDYRPTAGTPGIDQGTAPGSNSGYSLTPETQYKHPLSSETRISVGPIDVGAYEYNGGGDTTPVAACSDGIDNDGDTLLDYPDDPGCSSATDPDEYNAPPSTSYGNGDSVQTTAQVNVRDSANGNSLGTQPSGSGGTVVGGPVVAGGYIWWQIDFGSGVDGWVAENYLTGQLQVSAPTVSLSASPVQVTSGGGTTLAWSSTNATGCNATGGWSGTKQLSGSQLLSNLTSSATYTLTCTGSGGSATSSVNVTVVASTGGAGGEVVSVKIDNQSSTAQTDVPVTFGHVFRQGDVPAGMSVLASLPDGKPVPLQVDAKATHGDGSLRHAILTARIPSISGNNSVLLHLSAGVAASGTAVSLESLLASQYDARVNLTAGGSTYTLSARDLLDGGAAREWLAGPEVSEWIVGGPVRTSAGTQHPHLAAYFHIRKYADGRVRTDVAVENGWLQVSGPGTFDISASIQISGKSVYGPSTLTMPHHTRWHQVYWWKSSGAANPNLTISHDTVYLRATGAVPNYDSGINPGDAALNGLDQSIIPMDNASHKDYMPSSGAQAGIGLLPNWDALYVTSGDRRAFASVLANASGGGAYGAHYRDEATGKPLAYSSHPDLTEQGSSLPGTSGSNPLTHDEAHQPSIGFLAYLISGDYYYLEEMQFWATWNYLWTNAPTRQYSKGIYFGQVRGMAWALRTLGQAAYITPDVDPLKAEFTASLAHNLAYNNSTYANNPNGNKLGAIRPYYGYTRLSQWMDDFYTATMGYLVDMGFNQAVAMWNWKSRYPVGRMGTADYCYIHGSTSYLAGGPSAEETYPDFKTLYEVNFGANDSCPEGQEMDGYAWSEYGYVANMRPALATAVDAGVPGALEAWYRMQNSAIVPDYNKAPVWGVTPRTLTGNTTGGGSGTGGSGTGDSGTGSGGGTTTPAPVVSLAAEPAQVVAGGSTMLTWSSTNATGCSATGAWSGSKPASGSQQISNIQSSSTFTLSCTGDGGSSGSSVSVSVSSATGDGGGAGNATAGLEALSFSSYSDGAGPVDWYDTAADNSMVNDDSLFNVFSVDGNKVFGTGSLADTNIHSHYIGGGSAGWSNYRYTGRMRISAASDSIGVTFYSDYPNSDYYYRLRRESNGTFHIAPHGASIECAGTADTGVNPAVDTWYHFLVEVENGGTQTDVRVKVWPQDGSMPGTWQASCSDTGTRLVQGTVGLWSVVAGRDAGNKYWDDLAVEPLGAGGGTTEPAAPVVMLSASPTTVAYGDSSVLSWSSSNADSCAASGGWNGSKGTSGSESVGPVNADSVYSLVCTGAGGSATSSVTLMVSGTSSDTDADGLPDSWEIENFGGLGRDGSGDQDNDGLTDLQEFTSQTSPTNPDSDGDGISDGQEFADGTDPTQSDLLEAPVVSVDSVMSVRDSSADVTVAGETTSGVVVDMSAGDLRIQLSDSSDFSGSLVMDRTVDLVNKVMLPPSVLKTNKQYWVRASVSDSNGRNSLWSQAAVFMTDVNDPLDLDGDGVDDQDQIYGFVDTDGNGVQDTDEGMCAMLDPVSGMPVGLRAESGALRCASTTTLEQLPGIRNGKKKVPKGLETRLSHGLYNFVVEGLPVDRNAPAVVAVQFYFSDNLGVDKWYKYDEMTTVASDYSSNVVINGNVATVLLTDGGSGDADGVVNGRIVDPSGPTDFDQATASSSGGEGGGGALRLASLLFLLMLTGIAGLLRQRLR